LGAAFLFEIRASATHRSDWGFILRPWAYPALAGSNGEGLDNIKAGKWYGLGRYYVFWEFFASNQGLDRVMYYKFGLCITPESSNGAGLRHICDVRMVYDLKPRRWYGPIATKSGGFTGSGGAGGRILLSMLQGFYCP
jgi:hypothetical protein